MKVEQINPSSCWTYLLTAEDNSCVLIDPVIIHVDEYLELFKKRGLTLTHIIDTHTHADHISAGSALKEITNCEYIMHEKAPAKCVTTQVQEGDVLNIAGEQATVLETPGHTRDSISLLFEDKIFTGDFLFLDDAGAGRDDLPGGDPSSHWESLQKLKDLPDDIMVYPAHEYQKRVPSTLGNQRKTNPHLKDMHKDEFITYINDLKLGPADWMKDVLKANYSCSTDPNAAYIPTDVPACEIKGTLSPEAENIQVEYIEQNELSNLQSPLLLDVRESSELNGSLGHIDGVVNIPVEVLSQRLDEISQHKDNQIITICRSGSRAKTAAQLLISSGFSDVKVLKGGMSEYKK